MNEQFKQKFCNEVVEQTLKDRCGYIDATITIAERFGISPEVGAKLLSKPIIEKIKMEGQEINLLPKISQLPF